MREGRHLKKNPNNQNMSGLHSNEWLVQFRIFLRLQAHEPIMLGAS